MYVFSPIFSLKNRPYFLGHAPKIKRSEIGLKEEDLILMVNGVNVSEHTHDQINESIRAASAVDELSIVIQRQCSFLESIRNIESGVKSSRLIDMFDNLEIREGTKIQI